MLGSSRRQSGHREQRQNDEPLIVVINGDKRPLGGDRYVVPVWHRILTAIRHPERERRTALYGRLDPASRHGLPLRRQACLRKRFLLANKLNDSRPAVGSGSSEGSPAIPGGPGRLGDGWPPQRRIRRSTPWFSSFGRVCSARWGELGEFEQAKAEARPDACQSIDGAHATQQPRRP